MGHSNPFPPPSYIREMSTIIHKNGQGSFLPIPNKKKEGRKEEDKAFA
jgi:hypothetical protein